MTAHSRHRQTPSLCVLLALCALAASCDDAGGSVSEQDTRDVSAEIDTQAADLTPDVTNDLTHLPADATDTQADTPSELPADVPTELPADVNDLADDGPTCPSALCATTCCNTGERCVSDRCLRSMGACTGDEDCQTDSFCDVDSQCTPFGAVSGVLSNPLCTRVSESAGFRPTVQCEWVAPPAGDPRPNHTSVNSTPVVVDFQIGHNFATNPRPSIVFTTTSSFSYTNNGILRVIDGRTCDHQYTIDVEVASASTPAVADLNGDGRPEIISWTATGNPIAFTYDPATDAWSELWQPTFGSPQIAAPSVHDIDHDNVPEVIYGGLVVSHDGVILNPSFPIRGIGTYMLPLPVLDLDGDGITELIEPLGVRQWNASLGTAGDWELEAGWVGTETAMGFVAAADFGDFVGAAGDGPQHGEVASIINGNATVRTCLGETVFGPIAIVGGPNGGNPVIADFDGDGLVEFGAGGPGSYTTFDPDCQAVPRAGGLCASARLDGILWTTSVRDFSIGINGTSIFDFDGDGRTEVVYADECFLRVFDGVDGTAVFSAERSSATWLEMPIVADVDADFNAEIVVGNYPYASACGAVDPIHPGIPCLDAASCVSGVCDAGFCRCSGASDCPSSYSCVAPLAGTAGTGDVCRAAYQGSLLNGIRVYQDAADGWVSSRMIWNQYAYFVTNVTDTGQIPGASAVLPNWLVPGMNHFRQNVQGNAVPDAAPDLTSRDVRYDCIDQASATLFATVCNRGTEPVGTGTRTGFYRQDVGGQLGSPLCIAEPSEVINPGECVEVSCTWSGSVEGEHLIVVVPDVDKTISECVNDNNGTVLPQMLCAFN